MKDLWGADLTLWTVSMIYGMSYFLILYNLSFTEFLLFHFSVTMTKGGKWRQASLLRDSWAFCIEWQMKSFYKFSIPICWENRKWLVVFFFCGVFLPIYYSTTRMLWTSATGHCRERRRQQIIWGLACTSCQGPQLCCLNSRELPWIPWVKFPFHHPDRCLAMPSPRPNRFTEISFRKIKTLEKAARLALFEAFVWGKMHIIRRVHIH